MNIGICPDCHLIDRLIVVHPSDSALEDIKLCVSCAKESDFVECPQCHEWDSKEIRGDHIICKWCVEDLVIKHEREHGYQRKLVTA